MKLLKNLKWYLHDKSFFTKWYSKAVENNSGIEYATTEYKQKMIRDATRLRSEYITRLVSYISLLLAIISIILVFIV
jgi:hypothetical protein